eukprot:CAMPEP_0184345350 /NCGR_PEP_ID=MMETSP1089-20130417/13780_1 /TAXON_ID=38269 ORGANISM="Gloeochaete wittrockiana, Strain SAG46.84" /NCGR_SAMPLE_ID=MMETSP1089 /ASSEMBLY_ACC=CAM_ASM_000445 /LENGTH=781 /DNA_ID=CAMNT_0026675627 /DNA_START=7 /DNA_END=2352 /DNA_ORIENTATION=+
MAAPEHPEGAHTVAEPAPEVPEYFVAFDIGNLNTIVSVSKYSKDPRLPSPFIIHKPSGGIDIASVVGFGDEERCFSDEASSLMVFKPANCIYDLMMLLGKKIEEIPAQTMASFRFKPTTIAAPGVEGLSLTGVDLQHTESTSFLSDELKDFRLPIEALVASFLKYLLRLVQDDKLFWQDQPVQTITKCVFVIPSYFDDKQKAALVNAAQIAGLTTLHLTHSTTAAALYYCYGNQMMKPMLKDDIKEGHDNLKKAKAMIVIDSGHRHTTVEALLLNNGFVKVLARLSTLNVGGHQFNQILFDDIRASVQQAHKIDPASTPKSASRLYSAVERSKKVLSTIADTFVEISLDDKDIRIPLSRAKFESLIEPSLADLSSVLQQLLEQVLLIDPEFVSSRSLKVEIIGGNCRVPVVQSRIQSSLNVAELFKNLDGSTSACTGAILAGRILSPLHLDHRIVPAEVHDLSPADTFDFVQQEDRCKPLLLPASVVQFYADLENRFEQNDETIRLKKELRNKIEQRIYFLMDELNVASSSAALISEQELSDSREALDLHQAWILYGDEAPYASLDDLTAHLNQMNEEIQTKAPRFYQSLLDKEEAAKKREIEQALAEGSRTQGPKRDRLQEPRSAKEKIEAAKKRKEQGSQLFKELNYDDASLRFSQALTLIGEISVTDEEKFKEDFEMLFQTCSLNLALCLINVKKFAQAIETCTYVIRKFPTNVKALFRRGQARFDTKDYEEALVDFRAAEAIEPSDANIKKSIARAQQAINKKKELEKQAFKKLFSD